MMTMTRRWFSLLAFTILASVTLQAQKTTVKGAFLEKWDNSLKYLVAIAEAMPEEHFEYKPMPREMSFIQQLIHIQENIDWVATKYFDADNRGVSIVENDKKRTIENLKHSFKNARKAIVNTKESNLDEVVGFFAGPKSKYQILNLLQDHVTHHRGQLIVYLNLMEIEPPAYVGW
ncbi:DinB family protein [Dokdonia sp. Hel_I_53]|uniref:DinB family protein n=1 Tax=Dokdonia sp. Hel_I_53 TaxID=1566287 RepID=UPI00119C6CE7|nr:DinB family protein [Dokdonia sp. Hel_I_53]TVZ52562.1 DinB family protein [Dokdonia sp. Hel_I_53]